MKQNTKIAKERFLKKIKLMRASNSSVDPNETQAEKKARIARAKKDYAFMVSYYFPHYATCDSADFHVQFAKMVAKNPKFKGFAEWGRGLAKSVTTDILIPFWLWMRGEEVYMVIIGNSEKKAIQLLADLRAEFEQNPRIIADFGEQKSQGSWEEGFFITKSGFIGQALGMGQNVRGLRVKNLRPNYIVPDDIETKDTIKNERRQDEVVTWILQDLIPTMDGETRRFIQSNNAAYPIMIQKKLQALNPKWKVHDIKAYNPVTHEPRWKAKYSRWYYKELEEEIGILAALSEYNNEPHVEGKIFKNDQIQWCQLPKINHFKSIVGHWDVAYAGTPTADYNAVKIWGLKDKNFYQIDCFVKKTKMRAAIAYMCSFQISLAKSAIVHWQFEAQFWNDEVERTIQEVEEEFGIKLNIIKVQTPKTKKYDRMLTMQPYYQNGRVWYNQKLKSHNDTQVGLAQLFGIEPNYKGHDDSPDADERCFDRMSKEIYTETKGRISCGTVTREHVY